MAKKRRRRADPEPGKAYSLRQLAKAVPAGLTRVRAWLRHPEWRFRISPPWDVAAVRAWRDECLRKPPSPEPAAPALDANGNPLSLKSRLDAAWRAQRTRREKALADAAERLVHPVAECRARRRRQIHEVRRALLALPRTLAPRLAGRTPDEIEALLDAELAALCNAFASAEPDPAPADPAEPQGGNP